MALQLIGEMGSEQGVAQVPAVGDHGGLLSVAGMN